MSDFRDFEDLKADCEDLAKEIEWQRQSIQRELGSRAHGIAPERYKGLSIGELMELERILR